MEGHHHTLFRDLVEANHRFVLTTHMNPDGDAIGSELGLSFFLEVRGCEVRIINPDPVPENFRYLEDGRLRVEVYDERAHDAGLSEADLVVLLDNSAPDRLGKMEAPIRAVAGKTLCIDHHPAHGTIWAHDILDEKSSATAAMVFDLVLGNGYRLDRRAAEALYAGLATDTGYFRFNSTTPRAHEIAAELLRAGAEPARCFREVCERNTPAYTKLLGQALAGLRLDAGGALVSVRITKAMETECAAEGVDTSEMTTPLLAIDRVRVALLFRELDGGRVKVSLRSKGDLDVYRLATEFGGGGHRNASGIVVRGDLCEIAAKVIERALELLG